MLKRLLTLLSLSCLALSSFAAGSVSVTQGQQVTLSVTADGTAPFTYQWSKAVPPAAPVAIASAPNASTYVIPSPLVSDSGVYSVVLSNSAGTTTSDNATITVTAPLPPPPPTPGALISLWAASTTPKVIDQGVDSPVELGLRFSSDVDGTITAIRFYKASANTGIHVAHLWSATGTLLATVTFTGETASGWQQANLSTPVAITAGTVYVASYHSTIGHYSADSAYFTSASPVNPPLRAASGINGVYSYGAGTFPNQTYNTTNYWVDVVFQVPVPVVNVSPSFTTQPASQSVKAGTSVTFTSVATGTPSPTYQWRLNGTAISGATNASLTLASVTSANAGAYTVIATNAAGSVTSASATLTVTTAPSNAVIKVTTP